MIISFLLGSFKEGFIMYHQTYQKDVNCIFCKIVRKQAPAYIVWESNSHMAFLSIFPNTPGATVVIPKKHFESYVFDLNDHDLTDLIIATKQVAKLLDRKLDSISRTAAVFEGFGINHAHAKLFPMHGTSGIKEWKPIKSSMEKYFDSYEGYISSHDGKRATDKSLEIMQNKIIEKKNDSS